MQSCKEIPESEPIRNHLMHYSSLITYLLRLEKGREMDDKILGRLRSTSSLPDWNSILGLQEYAGRLERCYRIVKRELFLQEVQRCLVEEHQLASKAFQYVPQKNEDALIASLTEGGPAEWLTVGLPIAGLVNVAVTMHLPQHHSGENPITIGYRRIGKQKDEEFEQFVKEHQSSVFSEVSGVWYYAYEDILIKACVTDPSRAAPLANTLAHMYRTVFPHVEKYMRRTGSR